MVVCNSHPASASFIIGRIESGIATLLDPSLRSLEFPATLLPSDLSVGMHVSIAVAHDQEADAVRQTQFLALQDRIASKFLRPLAVPSLKLKARGQTFLEFEFETFASCNPHNSSALLSIDVYCAGKRLLTEVGHGENEIRVNNLESENTYETFLEFRTTNGRMKTEVCLGKTRAWTDFSGTNIVIDEALELKEEELETIKRIANKLGMTVSAELSRDTTHILTATDSEMASKAKSISECIKIVKKEWLAACEDAGKLVDSSI